MKKSIKIKNENENKKEEYAYWPPLVQPIAKRNYKTKFQFPSFVYKAFRFYNDFSRPDTQTITITAHLHKTFIQAPRWVQKQTATKSSTLPGITRPNLPLWEV